MTIKIERTAEEYRRLTHEKENRKFCPHCDFFVEYPDEETSIMTKNPFKRREKEIRECGKCGTMWSYLGDCYTSETALFIGFWACILLTLFLCTEMA